MPITIKTSRLMVIVLVFWLCKYFLIYKTQLIFYKEHSTNFTKTRFLAYPSIFHLEILYKKSNILHLLSNDLKISFWLKWLSGYG